MEDCRIRICNYSVQSLAEPQVTYENQGIMSAAELKEGDMTEILEMVRDKGYVNDHGIEIS